MFGNKQTIKIVKKLKDEMQGLPDSKDQQVALFELQKYITQSMSEQDIEKNSFPQKSKYFSLLNLKNLFFGHGKQALAGFLILCLLIFSSALVVSFNSLPGDNTYQIKLLTEKTRLKFSQPQKDFLLYADYSQERTREIAQLTNTGYDVENLEQKKNILYALSIFNQQIKQLAETFHYLIKTNQVKKESVCYVKEKSIKSKNNLENVKKKTVNTELSKEVQESQQLIEEAEADLDRYFKHHLSQAKQKARQNTFQFEYGGKIAFLELDREKNSFKCKK